MMANRSIKSEQFLNERERLTRFYQYIPSVVQKLLTDFQRKKCTVPTLVHRPLVKLLKTMRKRKTENKNPQPRQQKGKSQKSILHVANAMHKTLLQQSFVWLAGKGSSK
jgi:type VI protein secretion system component VasK